MEANCCSERPRKGYDVRRDGTGKETEQKGRISVAPQKQRVGFAIRRIIG